MTLNGQPLLQGPAGRVLPWLAVVLAGMVAPGVALTMLAAAPDAPLSSAAPVLAVGMMAAGMIAGAAAGRLWTGISLALLTGSGLMLLARVLGLITLSDPVPMALAVALASISFAARGALFFRSAAPRGWWVAVAVVCGEAAMLATAAARPGALPEWLLVLLPAQWASSAIEAALNGGRLAFAELIALAGTAAATVLVTRLLPRRWPYLIMFSVWLGLSALVWLSAAG